MSSTIAHATSASFIALTSAHLAPSETPYILAALVSASALDVDHLFFVIRDRALYRRVGYAGNLHRARSACHELIGLLAAGTLSVSLYMIDPQQAAGSAID